MGNPAQAGSTIDIAALPIRAESHQRSRLEGIDVLRGFAALWVVLSHYLPHWKGRLGPAPIIVPNAAGPYAVQLFFAISGFVIFMTLEKCATVPDFAIMRFSRLYPAYWTTLAFSTAAGALVFHERFWPASSLAHVSMCEEFLGFPVQDVVYWSLTAELAFYLHAAWLFAAKLHRYPRGIVLAWLAGSLAWGLTAFNPALEARRYAELLTDFDYAPYFAIGIVFYDASRRGWHWSRVALIALAIAVEYPYRGWEGIAVACVVALLMFLAVRGHLKFLVSRVTLWLGGISYSIYLLHRNLGYGTLDLLHKHGLGAGLAVPLTLCAALGLASLQTYWIERPANAWIRGHYGASRRARSRRPES